MEQAKLWAEYPILGTMWKTKHTRFQAADRLRARAKMKGFSLSFVSAYVLIFLVFPKYITEVNPDIHRDTLGFVGTTASVLILVMSVISIFDEDRLRGQYMHDNARNIANIYQTFKLIALSSLDDVDKRKEMADVNAEYQAALDRCPHNHDTIDYERTCIAIAQDENRSVFLRQVRVGIWYIFDVYFWPVVFMVLPLVVAAFLIANSERVIGAHKAPDAGAACRAHG